MRGFIYRITYVHLSETHAHSGRVCHGYFNSADRNDTETVGAQMCVAELSFTLRWAYTLCMYVRTLCGDFSG